MKAPAFRYERAATLDEALDLLHRHGEDARIIAGGQSLVPALNFRLAAPGVLVDIGGIEALRRIRLAGEWLRIGALVRHAEIERSPEIAAHAPLLRLAVRHVAHAAIRNRGTFGGSIAHADPASEFPACAVALAARMHIQGRDGVRVIAAEDFFRGAYETAIAPGEILTAVEIGATPRGSRAGFAELARRQGDYALVGLAFQGTPLADGRFETARPVFFSVGSRPILAHAAAKALMDHGAGEDRLRRAQQALDADLDPPSDPQASALMRLHLARVLLGRVVTQLLETPHGE